MADSVTVKTAQGYLKGRRAETSAGQTIDSFKGIPYAKPPIGPLRFMAPQPPEKWSGIRDALEEGNSCPQIDMIMQGYIGEEDCLFLNIYSPKVQTSETTNDLKPVMVWFHGGGFQMGHGGSDMYGPDFLVQEDVVLVTLNYRVGPLGFLSLQEAGVSGNAGLKDQVAALQWVQQNIRQFGGDPDCVTIFGESAGGACVHYHMLSPMSKGLFHRAIAQSGSALNWWAHLETSRSVDRAFDLGKMLGLSTSDQSELVEFLQQQPAEELIKQASRLSKDVHQTRSDPFPFVPTVEMATTSGEARFLPDLPVNMLRARKVNHVPFMTGVNSQEGMLIAANFKEHPSLWQSFEANFERKCLPHDMNLEFDTALSKDVTRRIREFYMKDKPISYENRTDFTTMIGDYWFGTGVDKAVQYAATTSAPVYYYQLSIDGEFNVFKKLMGLEDYPGACHADDLGYLFSNAMTDHGTDSDSPAMIALKRMCRMWANFARTGNPTPELSSLLPVKWEPASRTSTRYLDIDHELTMMKQDREKERMQFWENLYKEMGLIREKSKSKI